MQHISDFKPKSSTANAKVVIFPVVCMVLYRISNLAPDRATRSFVCRIKKVGTLSSRAREKSCIHEKKHQKQKDYCKTVPSMAEIAAEQVVVSKHKQITLLNLFISSNAVKNIKCTAVSHLELRKICELLLIG